MAINGKASSGATGAQGTALTGGVAPSAGTGAGRERVTSSNYLGGDFATFKNSGLSMRVIREAAIAANKPVPTNNKGTEMCLSCHVLGFCWNNCHRAEDHRAHTASENTKLKAWCTAYYREGGPL